MKKIVATITEAGQVKLPAEVMRILGVKPRDQIAFEIKGRRVAVEPVKYTIESAAGSVGPPTATEHIERLLDEAKEEMAASTVAQMRGD